MKNIKNYNEYLNELFGFGKKKEIGRYRGIRNLMSDMEEYSKKHPDKRNHQERYDREVAEWKFKEDLAEKCKGEFKIPYDYEDLTNNVKDFIMQDIEDTYGVEDFWNTSRYADVIRILYPHLKGTIVKESILLKFKI